MSLTVCLLTRNDEARLGRVLESVAGVADDVLVGDTGSTDGTVTLAQSQGARVVPIAWDDDFGKARCDVLAQARGDWVLWLNPDEELDRTSTAILSGCLQEAGVLAFNVPVRDYPRPQACTESIQPRLFRTGRGIGWRGRLYAAFEPPLEALAARHHLRLASASVLIHHYAYLSQLNADKLRWSLRLLEKELADRPGQLEYLVPLGRTLLTLKDPRGHEVLAQAAAQVNSASDAPVAPTATIGSLFEYLLTDSAAPADVLPPERIDELAEQWFPVTPPVLWARALRAFMRKEFDRSRQLLERLVELGQTGHYDRRAPFEPSIIGGLAWLNLGICWAKLNKLERAEMCFAKLLQVAGFEQKGREFYTWVQQQKAAAQKPS
jgi:hypothetical protein